MQRTLLVSLTTLCFLTLASRTLSEPVAVNGGELTPTVCIPEEELQSARAARHPARMPDSLAPGMVTLEDPTPGGMNSFGKPVTNYVDHDVTSGLLDYECGTVTYDGHRGLDVIISDFYDMDEGVPFLCAAPGVVVAVHDGEPDRNLAC